MAELDLTRRRALTGAAVGGLSLPLLAACGGGSDSSTATEPSQDSSSPSPSDDSSSSSSDGGGDALAATGDVPVGGGVVNADAKVVVTQPSKGTFEGFSAVCTHQGCIVSSVSDGTINCPCHGSKYSIKDGSVVNPPAPKPLAKVAVKVDGGNIVKA